MSFKNPIDNNPTMPIPSPLDVKAKDRFGLPRSWSLAGETEQERKARESAVKALAKEVFITACTHLGRDAAKDIFQKTMQKKPSGKQANIELNLKILAEYDKINSRTKNKRANAIANAANKIIENMPELAGHSQATVERRIRRLIDERETQSKHDIMLILGSSVASNAGSDI